MARTAQCGNRDDKLKLLPEKHKAGITQPSAEKEVDPCREVFDRLRELMMMDFRLTRYTIIGQVKAAAVLAEILHMKDSATEKNHFEGWTDEELEHYLKTE